MTGKERGKAITIEVLKFLVYVGALVVGITVFMFTSQEKQDERIRENCTQIERNEAVQQEHIKHASEVFNKIDTTLLEQRKVMTETREALIRLDESTKQVAEQVKELSRKVP